jgi:CrcB protein
MDMAMEFAETAAPAAADDSSPRAEPGREVFASRGGKMLVLYIALGGALGAVARYGVGSWVHSWAGSAFPWGTFAINAAGSFLIGFTLRYLEGISAAPELRALITVGILGAFTTFSTFSYETFALLQNGAWGRAGAYAVGSLVVGLVAVGSGLALGARVLQPVG